jgi:copper(I)-binding protein
VAAAAVETVEAEAAAAAAEVEAATVKATVPLSSINVSLMYMRGTVRKPLPLRPYFPALADDLYPLTW